MARKLTYIPNRVIDTNGISDGASIYVYATGTTTPVSIYSDEALTTPLANPYVVAAGAAVPEIYHGESGNIRVRVVESGGTVVSDDDPYQSPITDIDLASTGAGKGAALVGLENGRTVAEVIASADATVYVDPTGDDTSGNGTSGNPYATIQKAVDSLSTLTGTYSAVIEVAAGTYSTSSRSAASMDRPAVVYIDGLKIGKRTAQSGTTLSGGLVIKLAAGAKITPNTTYPRGIYVTGHVGSVGIVGGEVEAATGAESLVIAHRGSYIHCRGVTLDGNSIAQIGLGCEAGGKAEMIDCSATGSTTDVVVYAGSLAQFAAPAGTQTIGSITNNSVVSLGDNMVVSGNVTHQGERFESVVSVGTKAVDLQGDFIGSSGAFIGPWVNFSDSTARVSFSEMAIRGDVWKFDAQIHLFNTVVMGNGWESFIAGSNSPHSEPVVLYGGAQFSGTYNVSTGNWGSNTIRNSAGVLVGPVYAQNVQTFAASGTVPLHWSGAQHTFVRLENSSGGVLNPMNLDTVLAANSMGGGNQPPDGSLWTFYTTSAQSMIFTPGTSIVTLPLGSMTLGTAAAACRSLTFEWSRALGKFQLVSFSLNVQTAPINTYAAPSGGATVDAECRASLAQLADDVANLRSKTQAARIHG